MKQVPLIACLSCFLINSHPGTGFPICGAVFKKRITASIPYPESGAASAGGMIIVGLVCSLIALKCYPLTKEKMEEIQAEVAAIKAKAAAEEA